MNEWARELIYYGALLAFLQAGSAAAQRKKSSRTLLLGGLYISLGVIQLAIWNVKADLTLEHPFLAEWDVPALYLIGPFLYFLGESLLPQKSETTTQGSLWKHCVPAALALVAMAPFYALPAEKKQEFTRQIFSSNEIHYVEVVFAIGLLSAIGYLSLSLWHVGRVWRFQDIGRELAAKLLLLIYLIAFGTLTGVVVSVISLDYGGIRLGIAFLSLSLFVFYFISARYDDILLRVRDTLEKNQYKNPVSLEEAEKIRKKLTELMEAGFYTKNDLTLKECAEEIGVSLNRLSQYLNEHEKMNFNSYINRLRIDRACELFKEADRSAVSVAYEVGYNNYTTFQISFKKIRGQSPATFRKGLLKD